MAKGKKGGNGVDDFDLDDFDLDKMDAEFDDLIIPGVDDDRSPVVKLKAGFVDSAKHSLKSPSTYMGVMKKALPNEYSDLYSEGATVVDGVSDLYNKSLDKLQPEIKQLKKVGRGLLPVSDKLLPKKLQNKLAEWLGEEEAQDYEKSKAEQREDMLSLQLGEVFATQIKESSKQFYDTKQREERRDARGLKQHKAELANLAAIRSGIGRLVGYQDAITLRYQQKTLENSYRQLYTQQDILEHMQQSTNKQFEMLTSLVKNTSLPDAVKLRGTEHFSQALRERFIQGTQNNISNRFAGVGQRIVNNLNKKVDAGVENVKEALSMILSANESTEGMKEYLLGGAMADGAVGAGQSALAKLLNKAFKLNERADVKAGAARIGAFLNDPTSAGRSGLLNENKTFDAQGNETTSALGKLANFLKRNTRSLLEPDKEDTISAGDHHGSLDDPAHLTNRMAMSVNVIMPGYLSRILREITAMRTGDADTPLTAFNLQRGVFTSAGKYKADIKTRLMESHDSDQIGGTVDKVVKALVGDKTLGKAETKLLRRQVLENVRTNKGLHAEDLASEQGYTLKGAAKTKKNLANFFKQYYRVGEHRKLGDGLEIDLRMQEATSEYAFLARNVPVFLDEVELQLRLGNRELLEELGLMKNDGKTSTLDYETMIDWLLKHSGGKNAPTNPASPKSNPIISAFHNALNSAASAVMGGNGSGAGVAGNAGSTVSAHEASPSGNADLTAEQREGFFGSLKNRASKLMQDNMSPEQRKRYLQLKRSARNKLRDAGDAFGEFRDMSNDDRLSMLREKSEGLIGSAREKGKRTYRKYSRFASDRFDMFISDMERQHPDKVSWLRDRWDDVEKQYKDVMANVNDEVEKRELRRKYLELKRKRNQIVRDVKSFGALSREDQLSSLKSGAQSMGDSIRDKALKTYRKYSHLGTREFNAALTKLQENEPDVVKHIRENFAIPSNPLTGMSLGGGGEEISSTQGQIPGDSYQGRVLSHLEKLEQSVNSGNELLQALLEHGIRVSTDGNFEGKRYGLRYGLRSGLGKLFESGGILARAMAKTSATIGGGVASLLGGSLRLGGGALQAGGRLLGGAFQRHGDVYVKGNPTPVMFAKGFKRKIYFDDKSGKLIKSFDDIKGPVYTVSDAGEKEYVLTQEDFDKGVFDARGKPILKRMIDAGMTFYGKLLSPIGLAADLASKTIGSVTKAIFGPQDIYVQGERLPRMLKTVMANGGYYSERTGKTIFNVKDIDGPVRVKGADNVVISGEDLPNLCNQYGKPFRTIGDRLVGAGLWAKNKAMGFAKGVWNYTKAVWGGMARTAKWGIKKLGSPIMGFLKRGVGLGDAQSPQEATAVLSVETNNILLDIRRILDERLPGGRRRLGDGNGDGIRDGSWQEQKANRKKEADDKATAKTTAKQNTGGAGIMAAIQGLFGKKKDSAEGEEEGEGDTIIAGGDFGGDGGDDEKKKKGKGKPRGRMGRAWDGLKNLLKKIPGAGAIGRFAGGAGGRFVAGRVATAAVMGGAGYLMGGSLGAALGVVAGLISLPVLLGGLAVAAVGVGAYMLYRKYSGQGKADLLNVRIAQYGLQPTDTKRAEYILKLEEKLASKVSFAGNKATLKASPELLLECMTEFGINVEDEKQVERWVKWFNDRFKPIYLINRGVLGSINATMALSAIDAKLTAGQKVDYLKKLKEQTGSGSYSSAQMPFTDMEWSIISSNEIVSLIDQTIKKFEAEAKAKGEDTAKSQAGWLDRLGTAALGIVPVVGLAAASYKMLRGNVGSDTDAKVQADAKKAAESAALSKLGAPAIGGMSVIAGTSMMHLALRMDSPIEAIRLKTYGLVELDVEKVSTLSALENAIKGMVTFGTNNTAMFNGSVVDLTYKHAPNFGVSLSNTEQVKAWTTWFTKRFIPTYLAFATAIRTVSETADIKQGLLKLNSQQKLLVATSLSPDASIWGVTESPWPGYAVNTDKASITQHIEGLKAQLNQKSLKEPDSMFKRALTVAKNLVPGLGLATTVHDLLKGDKKGEMGPPSARMQTPGQAVTPGASAPTADYTQKGPASLPTIDQAKAMDKPSGPVKYIMPTKGRISSQFGQRVHPISGKRSEHKGIDIAAPNGELVYAAASGEITRREYSKSYGNVIYIRHPDGSETRYAHLSGFQVGQKVGTFVQQGEVIGFVGNTGQSAGNHLHFEIRKKGDTPINPLSVINEPTGEKMIPELKGYAQEVQKGDKPVPELDAEGVDTIASTLTGKSEKDNPQSAAVKEAEVEKKPTLRMPTRPIDEMVATRPSEKSKKASVEELDAQRKAFEEQQKQSLLLQRKAADASATESMEILTRHMERSVKVQESMEGLLTSIDEKMGDVVKHTSKGFGIDPSAKTEANQPKPANRPSVTRQRERVVPITKTRYQ